MSHSLPFGNLVSTAISGDATKADSANLPGITLPWYSRRCRFIKRPQSGPRSRSTGRSAAIVAWPTAGSDGGGGGPRVFATVLPPPVNDWRGADTADPRASHSSTGMGSVAAAASHALGCRPRDDGGPDVPGPDGDSTGPYHRVIRSPQPARRAAGRWRPGNPRPPGRPCAR